MRRYCITDSAPFLGLPYQSQTGRLEVPDQGWVPVHRAGSCSVQSWASFGLWTCHSNLCLHLHRILTEYASVSRSPLFKRTQPSHIGLGATILQHDLNKLHLQRPTATWGHILRFWGLDFNIRICKEGHYSTHDRYQLCNEGPEQRKEWGPRP